MARTSDSLSESRLSGSITAISLDSSESVRGLLIDIPRREKLLISRNVRFHPEIFGFHWSAWGDGVAASFPYDVLQRHYPGRVL